MNTHLQTSRSLQPLLFSLRYPDRRVHRKEFRTLFYPSFRGCSTSHRRVLLWVRSQMDGHVDIDMDHPAHRPIFHVYIRKLQHSLNASSRWITVVIVLAVLVMRHDDEVLWALTGSILNTSISKLLKKMFNQQRPLTALGLKADPGMPSSHAQSFGFLGVYAAFGVILWKGMNFNGVAFASSVLLCCTYLAWLRVAEGLHTLPQVTVGAGFGCCIAAVWIALWHYLVRDLVASSIAYYHLLVGVFGLSSLCFLALGVRKWRLGEA